MPLLRFRYGAHLSREKVAELVAPHPDSLELVFSWLKHNGVPSSSISPTNGDSWLTVVEVPVSQANTLLGASYELYYHTSTNETILRTVGYALPAALHVHVQTVAPTTAFTSTRNLQETPRSHASREAAEAVNVTSGEPLDILSRREEPESYTEPSFLRWLYDMPFYYPAATDRNMLGIAGFGNGNPSLIDGWWFTRRFRADAIAPTVIVVPVNGGVNFQTPASETGNLDTQYSVALTYPTPILYYTIGGRKQLLPSGEPELSDRYVQWLLYMINEPVIPQTISVPYSTKETDLPLEYTKRLCVLFAELGARGVSVLVPSGDDGVGVGKCKNSYGDIQFYTTFPASCTCDFQSLLGSCALALAQVAHRIRRSLRH